MRKILLATAMLACASVSSAETKLSRAVQQGADQGFKACAPMLDQLVKFMHEDDEAYSHVGSWAPTDTDDTLFTALTGSPIPESTAISSFSAVKNKAGRCDATLTHVAPVLDVSCATVREQVLKDWKFYSDLAGAAIYDDPTLEGSSVILSPMGKAGCLIVKTVVLYGEAP